MAREIDSIYAPPGSRFIFNVNHPRINELYRRYKAWKGFSDQYPLDDKDRDEFERYLSEKIRKDKERENAKAQ